MLNAVSPALAADADGLADWFLHDRDPWAGNRAPHGELRRLARCVRQRREVEITVGRARPVRARPLGIVLKAGSWYLATAGETVPEVLCLEASASPRRRSGRGILDTAVITNRQAH